MSLLGLSQGLNHLGLSVLEAGSGLLGLSVSEAGLSLSEAGSSLSEPLRASQNNLLRSAMIFKIGMNGFCFLEFKNLNTVFHQERGPSRGTKSCRTQS